MDDIKQEQQRINKLNKIVSLRLQAITDELNAMYKELTPELNDIQRENLNDLLIETISKRITLLDEQIKNCLV